MAQAVQLMLAVFMAFAVFGVTLFSISRILSTEGRLRLAHAVCVGSVLVMMGAMMILSEGGSLFGASPIPLAKLGAWMLGVSTLAAIWLESGSKRWTLAPFLVLSTVVASGAPFV
ncbi:MAG: hypothetical protein AAFQ73_08340 [Pseudomonadota bacterium]